MANPSINIVGKIVGKKVETARETYETFPISVHQNEFNAAFIALAQKLRIIDAAGKLDPKQVKIDAVRAGWLEFPVAGANKPLTYSDIFNSNNPKLIVEATNNINKVCLDADSITAMNKFITVNKEREALKLTNFEKIKVELSPKTGVAKEDVAAAPAAAAQPAARSVTFKDPAVIDMLARIKGPKGSSLYNDMVNKKIVNG